MIATDPARDDCQLGQKRVTYATLQREYRCNGCGGRITLKPPNDDEGWHPECGRCGGRDFIHDYEWQRQRADAIEVLDGLPPELVA